jgi:hypothetical protein
MRSLTMLSVTFAAALCGTAYAQPDPSVPNDGDDQQDGAPATADDTKTAPANDGDLPPVRSDNDPQPEVATPGVPPGGFVEQAGVGGTVGYGRAGVLELGGSAGFTSGGGMTQINVAPSIGWFVADNLELTGIFDIAHASTDTGDGTLVTLLAEPSYHLPFNRTMFGFFGLGVGGSYVKGPGMAFAMAPRLGANFLIGRSGILTPSLSWQYNTHDSMDTGNGVLLQVSSAVRANVGYTVMW